MYDHWSIHQKNDIGISFNQVGQWILILAVEESIWSPRIEGWFAHVMAYAFVYSLTRSGNPWKPHLQTPCSQAHAFPSIDLLTRPWTSRSCGALWFSVLPRLNSSYSSEDTHLPTACLRILSFSFLPPHHTSPIHTESVASHSPPYLKQLNFPSENRKGLRRTPCRSTVTPPPPWRPPQFYCFVSIWAFWA